VKDAEGEESKELAVVTQGWEAGARADEAAAGRGTLVDVVSQLRTFTGSLSAYQDTLRFKVQQARAGADIWDPTEIFVLQRLLQKRASKRTSSEDAAPGHDSRRHDDAHAHNL
jgi:hypothetical protein